MPCANNIGAACRNAGAEAAGLAENGEGTHMKAKTTTGRHAAPKLPEPSVEPTIKDRLAERRKKSILFGLGLVFVLLLILAFALRGAAGEKRYREQLRQAEECYAAGSYENALGHLRHAAAREDSEKIRLMMVDCYEAMGSYDKALELLRQMDIREDGIRERIALLEQAKDQLRREGKIQIAGREYDRDANSLVIRDTALSEEDLRQLSELYSLSSLTLSDDGLTSIDALSGLGGLTMLDLSGNELSDLSALSGLDGLRVLYLDRNPVSDFSPVYHLQNLTMLSIGDIGITEAQLAELSQALPGCAIHHEAAVAELRELTLGGVTFREDVTELYLSGLQLSEITALSNCRMLKRLDLSGNSISDLRPLMDLPALEWLDISGNPVSDLRPLMAMRSLQNLLAADDQITSLAPLSGLTELRELRLTNNQLDGLAPLSGLTKLETLDLENTRLNNEELPVLEGLNALKLLNLKENPELTGEEVDALKQCLTDCYIEHSRLVYTSTLNGQRYRQDLTILEISGTGAPFDLAEIMMMSDLERLDLSGDELENIYPLRPLTKLRELDLSDNRIVDVTSLAYMNELKKLDLSNNNLDSITALLNLTQLEELDLRGNKLSDEQKERLTQTLENCRILFD